MSSRSGSVDRLTGALDDLAGVDLATVDDGALRDQVLRLVRVSARVEAELVRRVELFDRRGLSAPDGFRGTKGWLQAFGRISAAAAGRWLKAGRLLRQLPRLAAAARDGDVSGEHVQQVVRLTDQVGLGDVARVEATLAEAALELDPAGLGVVCERVRAHVDPDGSRPQPGFAQRAVTLSPVAGMVLLRGQLDAEGGAALATALDAVMTPPAPGDERGPAQRRADALVELARRPLTAGQLPRVGGQRPQVGVLVFPQALSPATLHRLAHAQGRTAAARRLRELATGMAAAPPPRDAGTRTAHRPPNRPADEAPHRPPNRPADQAANRTGSTGPQRWRRPGWADPPWLEWVGAVPVEVAQRIACDADVFRIVMDPANGMPLDLGRTHRLVPQWIRRALHARDRGCRWPGCTTPAAWSDAHHLDPWADGGETSVSRCVLLCRHHHGLVHEGQWHIQLDPGTGEVTITRPGGTPYQPPVRSPAWTGPTTRAGP